MRRPYETQNSHSAHRMPNSQWNTDYFNSALQVVVMEVLILQFFLLAEKSCS